MNRPLKKSDFSWHENGKEIWFYIGKKQYEVPDEITESIRLTAVAGFKQSLREFLEP